MSYLFRNIFFVVSATILSTQTVFAEARCQIFVDNQSIVHLKTQGRENEAYCMGYAHGRYRAVQMDHFRRTALGRTSEVYGFPSLKVDITMRLLNLSNWVDGILQSLDSGTQKYLSSYVLGANRGIEESQQLRQAELSNGYPEIERWTVRDSILVLLLQGFDQTRKTFSSEIDQSKAIEKWGAEKARKLYQSSRSPWETTILKNGEAKYLLKSTPGSRKSVAQASESPGWLADLWPSLLGEESGSNNWAIRPNLSKDKVAMLANDPHLDLKTPAFWMWIHIEVESKEASSKGAALTDSMDAIGATLPGVPVIANGTNRNVSWGLTNSYYNSANGYQLKDEDETISEIPLIWIKWYSFKIPFFFKRVQRTSEGFPILPSEATPFSKKIAIIWSGFFLKGEDISPMFSIARAQNAAEIDQLFAKVGLPSWNFVFADVKGNIGFRTIGRLSMDTEEEFGFHQSPASLRDSFQSLDLSRNPHLMNPKRSWIVTANNRHYPKESNLTGGSAYTQSFRAYRIEDLLQRESKHSLETFQKIQCDSQAVDAKFFVPHIRKILVDEDLKELEREFARWDFNAQEDCRVCGVYRWAMNRLMDELLVNETGLFTLIQNSDPEWFERSPRIFREALSEVGLRPWSEIHRIQFAHISGLAKWNYSPEMSSFGDKHSVSPGTSTWDTDQKKFWHTGGPSERFIVKMKSPPEIYWSLPGLNIDYHLAKSPQIRTYPWRDWAQCRLTRIQWPLNWNQVSVQEIQ